MKNAFPVIIVGLGSIGLRHAELLSKLGADLTTVSRRPGVGDMDSLAKAISKKPDSLLVIANETGGHMVTLNEAYQAGHRGPIAIEKPLSRTLNEIPSQVKQGNSLWVTYNMRYLPVIYALRKFLADLEEPILSVQMSVGQFLGDWRPERDIKNSYSSHSDAGGGALRDLSHELDLIVWLWGRPKRVCALGGRRGTITIDSDDCWNILMETSSGFPISLGINYFERPARRFIHIVSQSTTLSANLIDNTISVNGEVTHYPADRNTSYHAMWQDILTACKGKTTPLACNIEDAIATVSMINDCETSAKQGNWISHE